MLIYSETMTRHRFSLVRNRESTSQPIKRNRFAFGVLERNASQLHASDSRETYMSPRWLVCLTLRAKARVLEEQSSSTASHLSAARRRIRPRSEDTSTHYSPTRPHHPLQHHLKIHALAPTVQTQLPMDSTKYTKEHLAERGLLGKGRFVIVFEEVTCDFS